MDELEWILNLTGISKLATIISESNILVYILAVILVIRAVHYLLKKYCHVYRKFAFLFEIAAFALLCSVVVYPLAVYFLFSLYVFEVIETPVVLEAYLPVYVILYILLYVEHMHDKKQKCSTIGEFWGNQEDY